MSRPAGLLQRLPGRSKVARVEYDLHSPMTRLRPSPARRVTTESARRAGSTSLPLSTGCPYPARDTPRPITPKPDI